ncbi:MAG TPA: phosphate acetyltransferase [Candidatus Avipropionibacterium avicola]|uniref:Phosphate acetyltransferase n=1 Tax=Candidatus Avipropionibacterium avicola TaxID=2840701 RepID=A0A9D1GZL4_9ACTN|nr:phosphate acetyltransferase [Candidatus Avipropionibacterium avicola]
MTRSLYLASPSGHAGKSMVAFGLVDLLARRVGTVGVFRPVINNHSVEDTVLSLLLSHDGVQTSYEDAVGVTYAEVHDDPDGALSTIVQRYRAVAAGCEVTVVVGSDFTGVTSPTELTFNATVAANLGTPVLLVVPALDAGPDEVAQTAELAAAEIVHSHARLAGVTLNRCRPELLERTRKAVVEALADRNGRLGEDPGVPVWAIPEIPILAAPTVAQIAEALGGEPILGDPDLMAREAEHMLVAGMSVEHVLERLADGQLVIAAGDRPELLIALLAAHRSASHPSLAGVVLNGGFRPSEAIIDLAVGLDARLPVVATEHGTFETASIVSRTRGVISAATQRKVDLTLGIVGEHLPADEALAMVDAPDRGTITPLMFEATLLDRARADRRHIVLPEGNDDRVLRAASSLLSRRVADLTILGDESTVRQRASELGLDVATAQVLDPSRSDLLDEFAEQYAELRRHKQMTVDRAREVITDVSYFATMMVHTGRADGMVSGAAHTTAHTIRPSFEIIKTVPGTAIVSSIFLMCLADRVLVYGDCAVNPEPDAEQLADIAISSAATAAQFGVDPRVAMLSYSTGDSGSGAEVDKVRRATELVRERRPDLLVEGPLQYDAAVEPSVARTKMPDSPVAGRATVLIFPDLNTGNNTYKAVQRSAGAVAIGPVLQGLNKPVNDLSRGATVTDIINTVAITAVQGQEGRA